MPKYDVTETYTYTRTVTVEADIRDEAQDIAEASFDISPDDFVGKEVYIYEQTDVEEIG